MITKEKIYDYIDKIPPVPQNLIRCIDFLNKDDLTGASNIATKEKPLVNYLIKTVNRPIFGFKNRIENVTQIFGILGLDTAKQIIYAYLMTLLIPQKWKVFDLDNTAFAKLQSEFIYYWNEILEFEGRKNDSLEIAVNFIPASIFVAEEMFKENYEDFMILRQVKEINYNDLLQKFTNLNLFDISALICEKWEMDRPIIKLIKDLGKEDASDPKNGQLVRYMHLLTFYEFSKPEFIKAGLNDFIEFNPAFVEEIYENFNKITGIHETSN